MILITAEMKLSYEDRPQNSESAPVLFNFTHFTVKYGKLVAQVSQKYLINHHKSEPVLRKPLKLNWHVDDRQLGFNPLIINLRLFLHFYKFDQ